jgi:hypothetical protein
VDLAREVCGGVRVILGFIGRNLEYNFYRLPFTPPSLVCHSGLSVIPYCHVFETNIHFLAFVSQLSFNFYFLSSTHGSNPSSYRHHRLPSLSCRCLIFHRFSFTSRTEHVLKHPSELKFMKLSFQQAIIRMKRVLNKRVVPFLLWRCNL